MVFLDADMLVRKNMDELFDFELLGKDWIAANHACVCNLDENRWASKDRIRENCAYRGLSPNSAPTPVPTIDDKARKKTHMLLNSGMFVFTPYEEQWQSMSIFLNTGAKVKDFLFPDQDCLAEFFMGQWMGLGWQHNALKTMRYCHSYMWRDEEVRKLHYIVDKPWSKRVGEDGVAGYLGRDGVTHSWKWEE